MKLEDYNEYYIQGSDHYLIPKDVFYELFDEMENWRKESKELNQKYLNAVADYESVMFEKEQLNSLVNSCQEEIRQLKKQNDSLKQKLNWIAFGDDSELALRYLREIGYVDFDEERKVYINKHNNEPFLLKDEQEKDYYIKDNELNEYTEQLEYQIKELKKQLEEYKATNKVLSQELTKDKVLQQDHLTTCCGIPIGDIPKLITQQKEFISYLENMLDNENDIFSVVRVKEVLSKYKEIIGGNDV